MQDKRYDIHFHSATLAFTDRNSYKIEQLMQKRLSELSIYQLPLKVNQIAWQLISFYSISSDFIELAVFSLQYNSVKLIYIYILGIYRNSLSINTFSTKRLANSHSHFYLTLIVFHSFRHWCSENKPFHRGVFALFVCNWNWYILT